MSARSPKQTKATRETAQRATGPAKAIAEKWTVICDNADAIGAMAGLAAEKNRADLRTLLDKAQDWQHDLAAQGIGDIEAMVGPGLMALEAITARGQDATIPALALWREIHVARAAVLKNLTPVEEFAAA